MARLSWIDIAKGLAIIAVILGHTYQFGNPLHSFVYSFHIPLFFVLAGYTSRPKPMREVLSSSAKRLLLPYLALVAFSFLCFISSPDNHLSASGTQLLSYVFACGGDITSPMNLPSVGLAWFLMALFCARIIFNGVMLFVEKHRKIPELALLVFFLLLAVFSYQLSKLFFLPLALEQACVACLFLYLGNVFKRKQLEVLLCKWWVFLLDMAIWLALLYTHQFFSIGNMFFAENFYLGLLMVITSSFAVLRICMFIGRYSNRLITCLEFIGRNSLLLLCLHSFDGYFINWGNLGFSALGGFSFIAAGCIHVVFDLVLLWMVWLCIPSIHKKH